MRADKNSHGLAKTYWDTPMATIIHSFHLGHYPLSLYLEKYGQSDA